MVNAPNTGQPRGATRRTVDNQNPTNSNNTNRNNQPPRQQLHRAAVQQGDIVDQWVHRIRNDRAFRENRMDSTDRGIKTLAVITAALDAIRRFFPEQSIFAILEAFAGIALFASIVCGVWLHKQNLG